MADRAYSYEELGQLKDVILETCETVRRDNPTAWRNAHNGNFDETSTRYNDLCVQSLRARGIFAGCNGKRGGDQRSDDVLAFGLTDGRGAQDRSGRFPSMAIIDFITGAGGPNPGIGWGDVSAAAPGKFLDPQGLARVDGGTPPPPPPPPPDQPPPPADTGIAAALDRLGARIDALHDAVNAKPSKGDVENAINVALRAEDIMGFVREQFNEVNGGDGAIAKLEKWLRSRRALSF